MEMNEIIQILTLVGTVLFGGISLYLNRNKKVQELITKVTAKAVIFIREAEEAYRDSTKAGGKKFEWVVDKLHGLLPQWAQGIITREMLEDIVQRTFDEVEEYAKTQLDNKIGK